MKRETFFKPIPGKNGETFLDQYVRYGQKYHADKMAAANSLFGAEMIEIAHPAIPKDVEEWSSIERLNKERELVRIYLSAHPLDDYAIVLKHVCNTRMIELADADDLIDREELVFGGIVTEMRLGTTKTGNPYGIIKDGRL